MSDCFERHQKARDAKEKLLRESGLNSWSIPLSIDDPALERECFIEYQRQQVEDWKKECPHKVWRIEKGRFDAHGILETGTERFRQEDRITYEEGEFPVVVFKEKDGVFRIPQPPFVCTNHIFGDDDDLVAVTGGTSKNPCKYLKVSLEDFRRRSRAGVYTYEDRKTGKEETVTVHDKACKSCRKKIEGRGAIKGMGMTPSAVEALRAVMYLQKPLEFLDSLEGEERERIGRLLEMAYHAGKHGFIAKHPSALISDAAFELEDQQNKKKPRSAWTAEARAFLQTEGLKRKWWEVLEHLKSKNLAYWEGWDGKDCKARDADKITFEDGVTADKDRDQFQQSVRDIRKVLRKNGG